MGPENISIKPLPKVHRQTIIFDLDETLIHCNENLTVPHDVSLPIKFPNNTVIKAGINVRPYAR
jgi:CTD small phosphatase-like protein 2